MSNTKQPDGYNDPYLEKETPPHVLVKEKTENVTVDADEVNDHSTGEEEEGGDYLGKSKHKRSD